MARVELYGSTRCPYTSELREWLEWKGVEFDEYDVDVDDQALTRMCEATGGNRMVPVLIEDGKVTRVGWQGRGCIAGRPT